MPNPKGINQYTKGAKGGKIGKAAGTGKVQGPAKLTKKEFTGGVAMAKHTLKGSVDSVKFWNGAAKQHPNMASAMKTGNSTRLAGARRDAQTIKTLRAAWKAQGGK